MHSPASSMELRKRCDSLHRSSNKALERIWRGSFCPEQHDRRARVDARPSLGPAKAEHVWVKPEHCLCTGIKG